MLCCRRIDQPLKAPGSGIADSFLPKWPCRYFRTGSLVIMLWVTVCIARAQTGITNEPPYTVFRTGSGQTLQSLGLPIQTPVATATPTLTFEFGFATAETEATNTFFDSFSLTLQTTNLMTTALVLTADRTGVAWAPMTPGALPISPEDIERDAVPFANLSPALPLRFAYFVTFVIPDAFAGTALNILFDLFDNLNASPSLAYVSNLHVDAAALVRFYRLRSNLRTSLDSIRNDGASVVLKYHFLPQTLELQSAPSASGPYSPDTNFVMQAGTQTLSLPRPGGNRFYRLISEAPSRLVSSRLNGNQVLLEYELEPQFLAVESAFSLSSKFSEEPVVRVEAARRTLRVPKPGQSLPPL